MRANSRKRPFRNDIIILLLLFESEILLLYMIWPADALLLLCCHVDQASSTAEVNPDDTSRFKRCILRLFKHLSCLNRMRSGYAFSVHHTDHKLSQLALGRALH
jgi:hypothetical protein